MVKSPDGVRWRRIGHLAAFWWRARACWRLRRAADSSRKCGDSSSSSSGASSSRGRQQLRRYSVTVLLCAVQYVHNCSMYREHQSAIARDGEVKKIEAIMRGVGARTRRAAMERPPCAPCRRHLAPPAARSCRAGCCCCWLAPREAAPAWLPPTPPIAPSSICWYWWNMSREPRKKGRTAHSRAQQAQRCHVIDLF